MQTAGLKFPGTQGSHRKYYEPIYMSTIAQEIITLFAENKNLLCKEQR